MATREALEARKDALEAELARREALSTSERQAAYVLGANRREEPAEDRDVDEREPAWGDDGGRPERDGDSASRRQAARITRGESRRDDDE